ncbi:hypothetical protein M422DRAFT_27567 [Sphaerobolus stellatus SS14]|nr:hypothetical protein M422DRAFT_27567 [Sphaerobolus stellatus SS14]
MSSQVAKLSRKLCLADNDSEMDDPEPSLSPPPKKRYRSTTVEDSDYDEHEYSQPSPSKPRSGGSKGAKRKRAVSSEDDDFELESDRKPTRPKLKSRISVSNTKGKGKATKGDPDIIVAKNERKPLSPDKESQGDDMDIDIVPTAGTPGSPSSEPPKKKYPTIKKPKIEGSSTAKLPPKPAAGSVPKAPTANAGASKKSDATATTLNPSGTGDFDLRDNKTWLSLIGKGGTSSTGPKVGIEKRVSTQEHKKKLESMKTEAKAKRTEEVKNTFDLQGQAQLIAAFEKRMSTQHSTGIHYGPQLLGAAFKIRPLQSRNERP